MRNLLPETLCVCATACLLTLATGCQTSRESAVQSAPAATQSPAPAAAVAAPPAAATPAPAAAAPEPTQKTVIRIDAGAFDPFTDSSGNVWQADQGFSGGDTIERDPGTSIANTKDPQLFLTEHYAMDGFSCKVPNGKYEAKLYFAETFDGIGGPGDRVFSFNVMGHEFKDFDVWAKAGGPNRAYVVTVPVEVTDGKFQITFTSNIENPEINAIELIPQT